MLRRTVIAGSAATIKKDNRLQSQNGSVLKVSSQEQRKKELNNEERIEEQRIVNDETDPKKEGGGTKGRVAVKMARAIGLSRGVPWCGTLHTVRKRVVFQSILRTGFSTHTEGSRQEWFWVGQRARGGSSRTPVPRL